MRKLLFGAAVAALCVPVVLHKSPETTGCVRVTDKMVKDGEYLVYTKEEPLRNVDSWLFLKFNSATVYGKIEDGQSYDFRVNGWRFAPFSMMRNIISVEKQC